MDKPRFSIYKIVYSGNSDNINLRYYDTYRTKSDAQRRLAKLLEKEKGEHFIILEVYLD